MGEEKKKLIFFLYLLIFFFYDFKLKLTSLKKINK